MIAHLIAWLAIAVMLVPAVVPAALYLRRRGALGRLAARREARAITGPIPTRPTQPALPTDTGAVHVVIRTVGRDRRDVR